MIYWSTKKKFIARGQGSSKSDQETQINPIPLSLPDWIILKAPAMFAHKDASKFTLSHTVLLIRGTECMLNYPKSAPIRVFPIYNTQGRTRVPQQITRDKTSRKNTTIPFQPYTPQDLITAFHPNIFSLEFPNPTFWVCNQPIIFKGQTQVSFCN